MVHWIHIKTAIYKPRRKSSEENDLATTLQPTAMTTAIYKPRRKSSEENDLASAPVLDVQPPEMANNKSYYVISLTL